MAAPGRETVETPPNGATAATRVTTDRSTEDAVRELHQFLGGLLREQAALVSAQSAIALLRPTERRTGGVAARHPAPSPSVGEQVQSQLRELEQRAAQALSSDDPAPRLLGGPSDALYLGSPTEHVRTAIVPLVAAGQVEGVCALAVPSATHQTALAELAVLGARFETFLWQQQAVSEGRQKALLRETLELIDAAQQGEDARAMASLATHELARRFGCTRASVGLIRRDRIKLVGVSGNEDLDKRGPAAELLEAAMEECADQDTEVSHPAREGESLVTRAHRALSDASGQSSVLSLPLRLEGDLAGVLTLEREAHDPFPDSAVPLLRLIAEYLGPTLYVRRLADRGMLAVSRDRLLDAGAAIVGPRRTATKLVLGTLALIVLLLTFVPIPGRVRAPARIDAAEARTVAPPFTGYLASVAVEPGSLVSTGDVLAQMDTADLELSLTELRSRLATLETDRDEASQRRELARARLLNASIREAEAQAAMLEQRIERAEVRAPIDGIIGRGDLADFVGARVEPTQPLFELVTPGRVVVVHLRERSAPSVEPGDEGTFSPRALPSERVRFRVLRVSPVAEVIDGENVYPTECELLSEAPDWLRPGLSGAARIENGWTTGMAELAGPLVDELRMRLWW
ncbi:MAG: efflux RND transporter periplasmic adaptor subunit [Planctomycetota bacterium]